MRVRIAPTLMLGLVFAACGEGGPGFFPLEGLPASLRLIGTAAGPRGDGGTIDCGFDLLVTLVERRRTDAFIEHAGIQGGEAHRTTLDSTGAGFGFFADVYWPDVVARLVLPDSIELLLADTTVNDSRFWDELAFFAGARGPGDPGSGTWTCAPFDIWQGGYVDTMGVVQGTWQLQPQP